MGLETGWERKKEKKEKELKNDISIGIFPQL